MLRVPPKERVFFSKNPNQMFTDWAWAVCALGHFCQGGWCICQQYQPLYCLKNKTLGGLSLDISFKGITYGKHGQMVGWWWCLKWWGWGWVDRGEGRRQRRDLRFSSKQWLAMSSGVRRLTGPAKHQGGARVNSKWRHWRQSLHYLVIAVFYLSNVLKSNIPKSL